MRWWRGKWQVVGGWERLVTTALSGVCRAILGWTDNGAVLNVAFGTDAGLEVHQSGVLYDITPTLAMPPVVLGSPFTVSDGSATVTVNHPNHGLETGDDIVISDSAQVGRIVPDGTYEITVTDADTYTFTHGSAADLAETLGSNPLSVTESSAVVTVTDTAHGFATGQSITVSGAAAVGGITPNGTFSVTVIDANTYRYTFTSAATSTATGGGASVVVTVPTTGGGDAKIAPQNAYTAGQSDGTGGAGYGTGAYGVGDYSEPSTQDYWPRTWSLSAFGQALVASYRGGPIYLWENDTSATAEPILNAPRQVTYALVGPNDEVFAFGCNEEVSGEFNHLCIRHSGVRGALGPNHDVWNSDPSTTAREYILPGGGRIVSARRIGPHILVWTTHSLFLGVFVGSPQQIWRFDAIGQNCGLIGPNAAVVVGQSAYWLAPDAQFRTYSLGGAPQIVPCPIRDDLADNLVIGQADKIVASSIATFGEVRFDYPDGRDGIENSRYLTASVLDGSWSRGEMARTFFVDAGPSEYPIATDPDGNIYWQEKGHSADGAAITWHIETADLYLDENFTATVLGLWPDVEDQIGPITATVTSRLKPQGDERTQSAAIGVGDDKVDLRLSGRLFRLKFAGDSAPAYARVGKPTVDFAPGGRR